MKQLLFVLALLLLAQTQTQVFNRVLLTDPNAKCLDGSPGAHYLYQGDPTKILIFFEGGGWCGASDLSTTLESCYQRSKGALGSSLSYPPTMTAGGILSGDAGNYFKNWTKVFMKYCDGSGHQGSRKDPVSYKDSKLYFRGKDVTIANLNAVDKIYGLFTGKVTNLILSGCSAGGLASYMWANYLFDKIRPTTKYWVIPDSGMFLDDSNRQTTKNQYRIGLQNIMKYSNEETDLPTIDCNQVYSAFPWKCFFAQYNSAFIKAPLFPVQPLYDTWSIANILGIRCVQGSSLSACTPQERSSIEEYHKETKYYLESLSKKAKSGVWAPACLNHCYLHTSLYTSQAYRIPAASSMSAMNSIKLWMEGSSQSSAHIDQGDWPTNRPCSGQKISQMQ